MPLPAIRPKLGARRRDQIEATVRRAFEPVATLRHLRVVHAAAERHSFPDVGLAAHRNRHQMMDLAVPDGTVQRPATQCEKRVEISWR